MTKFWGVYYNNPNGTQELCEVDGGISYEAHRTLTDAELAASSACSYTSPNSYIALPIPTGIRVWDNETDSETITE